MYRDWHKKVRPTTLNDSCLEERHSLWNGVGWYPDVTRLNMSEASRIRPGAVRAGEKKNPISRSHARAEILHEFVFFTLPFVYVLFFPFPFPLAQRSLIIVCG